MNFGKKLEKLDMARFRALGDDLGSPIAADSLGSQSIGWLDQTELSVTKTFEKKKSENFDFSECDPIKHYHKNFALDILERLSDIQSETETYISMNQPSDAYSPNFYTRRQGMVTETLIDQNLRALKQ